MFLGCDVTSRDLGLCQMSCDRNRSYHVRVCVAGHMDCINIRPKHIILNNASMIDPCSKLLYNERDAVKKIAWGESMIVHTG